MLEGSHEEAQSETKEVLETLTEYGVVEQGIKCAYSGQFLRSLLPPASWACSASPCHLKYRQNQNRVTQMLLERATIQYIERFLKVFNEVELNV